jgi:hypothetical protein
MSSHGMASFQIINNYDSGTGLLTTFKRENTHKMSLGGLGLHN